ncbi:MAG: DMT family transporter [Chloroflexi bacterium]|nr:DMT family transporter [Chloroflexota bacterium]
MPDVRIVTLRPLLGLAVGVLAVSSAAVLIRLASAPPLSVSAYRLLVASLVVVPAALWSWRQQAPLLDRRTLAEAFGASVLLALHFGCWIASLMYTSVASSTVIVTANPLLVAVLTPLLTRDPVSLRTVVGILVALGGMSVLGFEGGRRAAGLPLGELLALLGALAVAGYYISGRRLRARLPALTYVALVYPGAAALLTLAALATGSPLAGFPAGTWGLLALLGLGPQVIGHSLLNWSLGYLPAVLVSTAVMAEPVGASALAAALLGEIPTSGELAGGLLILLGVSLALKQNTAPKASQPQQ